MEENIDNIIQLAGNKNRYQYITLLFTFLIWVNVELLPISLPFFEKSPEIAYVDQSTGNIIHTQLNYTTCTWPEEYYNVTKVYKHSWISTFNIECDKLLIGLIGSFTFAGVCVGSLFFKTICDGVGRKKTVLYSGIGYSITLLAFVFSNSIYMNYAFSFVGCFFCVNAALGSYILVNESVSREIRGSFGCVIMTGFSACGITYALLYKYVENWRFVLLISSVSTFIFVILFYLVTNESPIYYVYKGDYKMFMDTCKDIAKSNNREQEFEKEIRSLDVEYIGILRELENYLNSKKEELNKNSSNPSNKLKLIFDDNTSNKPKDTIKTPEQNKKQKLTGLTALLCVSQIRSYFLMLCYLWFTISGNYYGLTINLKNLKGDLYTNNIMNYTFEAFSYFFVGYVMNQTWAGRKKTILLLTMIAIIIFFFFSIFELSDFLSEFLTFLAKFAFAGVFNILYTYSLEVFPTCVRAQGFGINSAFARASSIIFPLLIEVLGNILNIVFLIMNIIGFVMVLFLPETLGRPLKDDYDDEEQD